MCIDTVICTGDIPTAIDTFINANQASNDPLDQYLSNTPVIYVTRGYGGEELTRMYESFV